MKKGKRKPNLPFPIVYYGFGKRKTKGRYIQHKVLFRFSFFHLAKEKTRISITNHISIFRFLFVDYEKGKGYLGTLFPFSIMK